MEPIQNPHTYLNTLQPGQAFYIAAPLSKEDLLRLHKYGLHSDCPARIPIPREYATRQNANGQWAGHQLLPPAEVAFIIENDILYSSLLINNQDSLPKIQLAMNMVLEMVGHFEICPTKKAPSLPPVKQYEIPWEIRRAGAHSKKELRSYILETVSQMPAGQQDEVLTRHDFLQKLRPEFFLLGTQNFFGYVVYGFPAKNVYVFTSNEVCGTTYAYRGDWETVFRLTKTEVLSGGSPEARICRNEEWEATLKELLCKVPDKAL